MDIQGILRKPDPSVYLRYPLRVLDLETTNLDYGSALNPANRIVLSVLDGEVLIGDVYEQAVLCSLIEGDCILVAHNAKFELQWMARAGLDLSRVLVWDTMIAEYVIQGNLKAPLSLDSVARKYGYPGKPRFTDICMKAGVCPSEMPQSMLIDRCKYDVNVTTRIAQKQVQYCADNGLLGCVLTRCLLTPVLSDIETNGIYLDNERVTTEYHVVNKEYHEVTAELQEIMGDVNPNSPQQLAKFLYEDMGFAEVKDYKGRVVRTGTDQPKTNLDTIKILKTRNKKQRTLKELLLRQSYLDSKLSKSLRKMKDCIEAGELLYAKFNQTVTATHRLSSSGTKYKIQFQNLPREYKKLFKARHDGWLIGEIDGAQLEFRVAAFMGQDTQAVQDIRDGVDVHSFTAHTITEAGQDTDRQEAKAHTFKPLYGGTSGTKAEQAYYTAFKEKYSGIASAQQAWINEVLSTKSLKLDTGFRFYWPQCRILQSGYVTETSSICNYPVQHLATAEIIPIALIYMWHALRAHKLQSFIVNTIHDSTITEVHPDEKELVRDIGIKCFTRSVYHYLKHVYGIVFNVPLGVGIKMGEHWSEGEEEKLNVEPS